MKLRETSQSPKHESLAQRVATLKHKLFGALEQIATIRKFLRDVVRVNVCRGYLAKLIGKVSESLTRRLSWLNCSTAARPGKWPTEGPSVALPRGRSMLDTSWASGPLAAFTAVWRGGKMGKSCRRFVVVCGRPAETD
jgi:hypothetical protein